MSETNSPATAENRAEGSSAQWLEPHELLVCATCGGLRGPLTLWRDDPPHRYQVLQHCPCTQDSSHANETAWPRSFDFPEAACLCRACGRVLLRSGLRWCVWLCGPCKDLARALNNRYGRVLVPIGRHSLMHNLVLQSPAPSAVDTFHAALMRQVSATDRLRAWQSRVVRELLERNGWKGNMPLQQYLDAVPDEAPDYDALFSRMLATP